MEQAAEEATQLLLLIRDKDPLFEAFFKELADGYEGSALAAPNWDVFNSNRAVAEFIRGFLFKLTENVEAVRDQYHNMIDELEKDPNAELN